MLMNDPASALSALSCESSGENCMTGVSRPLPGANVSDPGGRFAYRDGGTTHFNTPITIGTLKDHMCFNEIKVSDEDRDVCDFVCSTIPDSDGNPSCTLGCFYAWSREEQACVLTANCRSCNQIIAPTQKDISK